MRIKGMAAKELLTLSQKRQGPGGLFDCLINRDPVPSVKFFADPFNIGTIKPADHRLLYFLVHDFV